jgi:hypothetical protein
MRSPVRTSLELTGVVEPRRRIGRASDVAGSVAGVRAMRNDATVR